MSSIVLGTTSFEEFVKIVYGLFTSASCSFMSESLSLKSLEVDFKEDRTSIPDFGVVISTVEAPTSIPVANPVK